MEKEIKTQDDRLEYLVKAFLKESGDYRNMKVPVSDRRNVLRSLMNIRMPKIMDESVLPILDEFLREETIEKGVVTLKDIPTINEQYGSKFEFADKLSIWQGDITRLSVDVIVNAANSQMLGCFVPCHGCIDNAIHSAAGIGLREECDQLIKQQRKIHGRHYTEPTGQAKITKAYNLPSKAVIHTVGPIVGYGLTDDLRMDLESCYRSCLECLVINGYKNIAFCCISTGEFHFPNEEAAEIAIRTVSDYLKNNECLVDRVIFNVFKDIDREIYENLLS